MADEWSADYPSLLDFAMVLRQRPRSFKISLIENKSFSMSWSREAFVREIDFNPTAYYFVIEDDKNIFGYMGIWKYTSTE